MMTNRYEQALETLTFDEYWQRVEALDWFGTLSRMRQLRRQAWAKRFYQGAGRPYIYSALAHHVFDAEMIYEFGVQSPLSYSNRIMRLVEAAGGVLPLDGLNDEAIRDEDGQCIGVLIRLSVGSRAYEYRVSGCSKWFEEDVIRQFINGILAEHGHERHFIALPVTDQVMRLAFVSETMYRQAAREGLLPPPGFFIDRVLRSPQDWQYLVDLYYRLLDDLPPEVDHMQVYNQQYESFLGSH